MANFVYTNAKVSIDSTSLSDHVESVAFNYLSEVQDNTAMNSAAVRQRIGGLKDVNGSINFRDDFAASSVNATVHAAIGTTVAIKLRAVNTSISATNPEFQFNAILSDYGMNMAVGTVAGLTVNYQGNGAVTRAVA